jgi:hypothetical protein
MGPPTGLMFIPHVIKSIKNHDGWRQQGRTYQSIHKSALWESYQQTHLVADQEDLGKGNDGYCLQNISFILIVHSEYGWQPHSTRGLNSNLSMES